MCCFLWSPITVNILSTRSALCQWCSSKLENWRLKLHAVSKCTRDVPHMNHRKYRTTMQWGTTLNTYSLVSFNPPSVYFGLMFPPLSLAFPLCFFWLPDSRAHKTIICLAPSQNVQFTTTLPCSSKMPFGTFLSTVVTVAFLCFFNLPEKEIEQNEIKVKWSDTAVKSKVMF